MFSLIDAPQPKRYSMSLEELFTIKIATTICFQFLLYRTISSFIPQKVDRSVTVLVLAVSLVMLGYIYIHIYCCVCH